MSIAPVKCSVDVKAPLARAFELFAQNMGAWWPRGRTPGASPHKDVVVEPHMNGRWFERDGTATRPSGAGCLPGSRRVACCWAGNWTPGFALTPTC